MHAGIPRRAYLAGALVAEKTQTQGSVDSQMIFSSISAGGLVLLSGAGIVRSLGSPRRSRAARLRLAARDGCQPSRPRSGRAGACTNGATSRSEDHAIRSVVDRKVDQNLPIAIGTFGLAWTASVYPLAIIPTLAGMVHNSRFTFRSAYEHLITKRKVNVDVANAVIISVFVITGHLVLANVPLVMSAIRRRVVGKVKDDSSDALTAAFHHRTQSIRVLRGGPRTVIASDDLKVGDVMILNAGETIPADGDVVAGAASVDQHVLTGESQPVEVEAGAEVFSMTTLLAGSLHIRVARSGSETIAAQIGDILAGTVHAKTRRQLRSEQLVDQAMLPVMALAAVSLPLIGPSSALALLNAPPRDNLTIAGAIAVLNYLNLLSREGILVKDGRVLEMIDEVDTLVFDKTGTLTEEQPTVGRILGLGGRSPAEVLGYAALAEQHQTHPIARAISERAAAAGLRIEQATHNEVVLGYGLIARLDDMSILVGSERFMKKQGVPLPSARLPFCEACHGQGHSMIFVALNDALCGVIELRPTLRSEIPEVCRDLRARDKTLVILSGDHDAPTRQLAARLGIETYYAEALPSDKAAIVDQLQQDGRRVCFVGDGINDAIALKKAHVSVSVRGAATAATDTAQVVLMNADLGRIARLFDLAGEASSTLDLTYTSVVLPSLTGALGALFFGLGFVPAVFLNQLGLGAGLGVATKPLLRRSASAAIPRRGDTAATAVDQRSGREVLSASTAEAAAVPAQQPTDLIQISKGHTNPVGSRATLSTASQSHA